jgi:hypothetical protein
MGFWTGEKQRFEQVSNLSPEQMQLKKQQNAAVQGKGAGGAFGDTADNYRNLLSNESADVQAFQAPEMRRFNEQIMPDLASQFGGMGAGDSGLTGSSFRNAAIGAGTDLSERLAKMRADLRQRGAEGLTNIANQSMNPYMQNVNVPAQQGFLQSAASLVGPAASALLGPAAGVVGKGIGDWASSWFNSSTSASPTSKPAGIP